MAIETPKPQLWCVRMTGPDDLLHMDSGRDEAVAIAHELNASMLALMANPPSEHFPMAWAVPERQEEIGTDYDPAIFEANKKALREFALEEGADS